MELAPFMPSLMQFHLKIHGPSYHSFLFSYHPLPTLSLPPFLSHSLASLPSLSPSLPLFPPALPFSVYVSASKSMDCRVSSGFKGEIFCTFPAPEFAIHFDENKVSGEKNSSSRREKKGSGLFVPGALFSISPVGSEGSQSDTVLNFLPLNWAEKDSYTSATSCLQQLHLPSPSASFKAIPAVSSATHSATQATYSAVLSGKARSAEQCTREGILCAITAYFKDLGSSGWNVPPSTVAQLGVSLYAAALTATDRTNIDRNQNQNRNWKDSGMLLLNDTSNQNSNTQNEWKKSLWGIIRARLESRPQQQSLYIFPSELEPSLAVNGIEFRNFDSTRNLEDKELRNFRKIRNEERERSARKRRNSHFITDNDDIDQGEIFKLQKNEVIEKGIEEIEWAWSEKKKENRQKLVQGQAEEEQQNMKEKISLFEILGTMDEERNAADRLALSLEKALNSPDFNSDAKALTFEAGVSKKNFFNAVIPPENDDDVELFLLNCKEERKKFHNLSQLTDNILKQKFTQT